MMKTILLIVSLSLLTIASYQYRCNVKLETEIAVKDETISQLSSINTALSPIYQVGILNNDRKIDYNLTITDSLGTEFHLGDIIASYDNKVLICRVAEANCSQCNKYAIDEMKKLRDSFDINNIIFLIDCSIRSMPLFIHEYGLEDANVFRCRLLGIQAETLMFPYYFAVSSDLRVKGIYLPSKSLSGTDIDSSNLSYLYSYLTKQ